MPEPKKSSLKKVEWILHYRLVGRKQWPIGISVGVLAALITILNDAFSSVRFRIPTLRTFFKILKYHSQYIWIIMINNVITHNNNLNEKYKNSSFSWTWPDIRVAANANDAPMWNKRTRKARMEQIELNPNIVWLRWPIKSFSKWIEYAGFRESIESVAIACVS